MRDWLIIAGMGAITFALRISVIALFGRATVPPQIIRGLRFVPPAVLTALVTPALIRPDGPVDLSLGNAHLLAGTLAAVVAWKTKNTLLTIGTGLAALWLIRWLAP